MSFDPKFYLRVFWSRFPLFLVVCLIVVGIGVGISAALPKSYRAAAVLLVESSQIPSELAESTVTTDVSEQVQVVRQRILTRENLLELADRFHLFVEQPDVEPDQIVEKMRDWIAIDMSAARGQVTLLKISADAENSSVAAGIANAIVSQMLEQNAAFRTEVATDTLDFFQREVQRLGGELDNANRRILDFKNANVDALPETLEYRLSRQAALQERLTQVRRQITQLSDQRSKQIGIYETTGRTESVIGRDASPEERDLQTLRQQLRDAEVLFSENHPRTQVLRARVATLEEQLPHTTLEGEELPSNAVLLNAQLAQIDSQLAAHRADIKEMETEAAELQSTIERTPSNEISLHALVRDRDNIQNQYDTAVARLSAAATGERIELLAKGQRLTVVEQATEPAYPAKPNRKLIALASGLLGIIAGALAVALREYLAPCIRRPRELSRGLGITPLATLPYMETPGEMWRHRALHGTLLLCIFAALVGAGLFFLDRQVMPLSELMTMLTETLHR